MSTTSDYDGNLKTLSGGGLTNPLNLTWNALGQLTTFKNQFGVVTANVAYDPFGRRVWTQFTGGPSTFFIYDGDLLLGEIQAPVTIGGGQQNSIIAPTDPPDDPPIEDPGPGGGVGSGQNPVLPMVTVLYTWGANGLISERIVAQNKTLWYHYGPQGETRQLTNSAGQVVDTYLYSAYGVPISGGTTGSDPNPFRFGGQVGYYTYSTGLILCGARWYAPEIGRWTSRDPIGYSGGPAIRRCSELFIYLSIKAICTCDSTSSNHVGPVGRSIRRFWRESAAVAVNASPFLFGPLSHLRRPIYPLLPLNSPILPTEPNAPSSSPQGSLT